MSKPFSQNAPKEEVLTLNCHQACKLINFIIEEAKLTSTNSNLTSDIKERISSRFKVVWKCCKSDSIHEIITRLHKDFKVAFKRDE